MFQLEDSYSPKTLKSMELRLDNGILADRMPEWHEEGGSVKWENGIYKCTHSHYDIPLYGNMRRVKRGDMLRSTVRVQGRSMYATERYYLVLHIDGGNLTLRDLGDLRTPARRIRKKVMEEWL